MVIPQEQSFRASDAWIGVVYLTYVGPTAGYPSTISPSHPPFTPPRQPFHLLPEAHRGSNLSRGLNPPRTCRSHAISFRFIVA